MRYIVEASYEDAVKSMSELSVEGSRPGIPASLEARLSFNDWDVLSNGGDDELNLGFGVGALEGWKTEDYSPDDDWYWDEAVLNVFDTYDRIKQVYGPEGATGRVRASLPASTLYTVSATEALAFIKEGFSALPKGYFVRMSQESFLKNSNFTVAWTTRMGGRIVLFKVNDMGAVKDAAGSRGIVDSVRVAGGMLLAPSKPIRLGYCGEASDKYFFMDDYLIGDELSVPLDSVVLRRAKSTVGKTERSGSSKKGQSGGSAKSAPRLSAKERQAAMLARFMRGGRK